jgi:peptidoglycan/xylan/chitin deacetylase (PgdA/CDA1 family)
MTHSSALYRPSILELAREGNFQAIAYWMNSLLAPHGIHVRATMTTSGCLKILVNFRQPRPRDLYIRLRKQVVQFICYRLWTLNSAAIRDVRIVAKVAGESEILWKQSVRIVTPANSGRLRRSHVTPRQQGIVFKIWRSVFVSRLAVASFFFCYWLVYWEATGYQTAEQPTEGAASTALAQEPEQTAGRRHKTAISLKNSAQGNLNLPVQTQSPNVTVPEPVTVPEQFKGQIVRQVASVGGEKVIALTFDDGPWPNHTEQVLNILKEYNVQATFFWVGLHVQNQPEIAKKVVAAGHAIGNHTWRHMLQNMDEMTAAQEIGNAARLIYETTGVKTSLLRPPGGNLDGGLVPHAKNQGYAVTLWSVESEDYYVSAPIIIDNVLSQVQPGGIVLLHDGGSDRTATVQALPQILTTLQRWGYRFVTVPQLLEMQARQNLEGRSH